MNPASIRAALTWIGDRFVQNALITVESDGTIGSIVEDSQESAELELPDEALLPGMVNAHSHSFQRAMRGRTERFPDGQGSFWTWRETMYALVDSLDEQATYDWNLAAFLEMRDAGITTVGEFHYFHHLESDRLDHRLDRVVLEAARDAGIRIVLLQTFYRTGGIETDLRAAQRRFATTTVDGYLRALDEAAARLESHQSLGIVAHSIRAVPLADIEALAAAAAGRDLPFHMHLEEQRREIDECIAAYGEVPMRLVLDRTAVDERFTAIHCTHTREEDLREWIERGANVCITPLTEGNLGDGIQPHADLALPHLSVGTDCNARIDLLEEIRWLEYAQRLSREDRGVYRDAAGRNGAVLFDVATRGGTRSLRVNAGEIVVGRQADFFAVDLRHRALQGWTEDTLLDTIVFGGGNEIVKRSCVGGSWRPVRS